MAKRDGSMSIWMALRVLCRLYTQYGGRARLVLQFPALGTALAALHAVCMAVEASDDFPMRTDANATDTAVGPPDGDGGHAGGGW